MQLQRHYELKSKVKDKERLIEEKYHSVVEDKHYKAVELRERNEERIR